MIDDGTARIGTTIAVAGIVHWTGTVVVVAERPSVGLASPPP